MFVVLSPLYGLHEIGTARMHLTPRKSAPRLATDYPSRHPSAFKPQGSSFAFELLLCTATATAMAFPTAGVDDTM